jgi:PPP family 3-phenylpropionic acid transporter
MNVSAQSSRTARTQKSKFIALLINYFIFFAAIGAFWPFIGPHYRAIGLNGAQVGLVGTIQPISVLLLAPVIGAFADRRMLHRRVFRLLLLPTAAAAFLLYFATDFFAVMAGMILWACASAATLPILDSYAVTFAEEAGIPYGRIRLAGSLGFMVVVTAAGWVAAMLPEGAFLLFYGVLLLASSLIGGLLPPTQMRTQAAGAPIRFDLREALRDPALVGILAISFLTSIGQGTLGNFFGIFLAELGATSAIIGLASAIVAISEIPILLGAGWLQHRFGNMGMIALALGAYVVRFCLYAAAPTAAFVLPVQLIHGLTYAVFLLASVRIVYELAGRDRAATMQGVLAATLAAGSVLGAVVNGVLADIFGVRVVFVVAAVANAIGLAVFFAVRGRLTKHV